MLWPYLKIWECELIFGRAVKAISSPGVRSPCANQYFMTLMLRHYEKATKLEKNLPLVLTKRLFLLSSVKTNAQCSKWYEIKDMEISQITEENLDPPTDQGAYFDVLLSI